MIDESKIEKIKKGRPYSLFDVIAISVSLLLCVALLVHSCASKKEGETLIIKQSYEGITNKYKLSEDAEIKLSLDKGEMIIKIEDGAAWVVSSPCMGQDCVRMPRIKYAGRSIVCADCRVFISVEGQNNFTAIQ